MLERKICSVVRTGPATKTSLDLSLNQIVTRRNVNRVVQTFFPRIEDKCFHIFPTAIDTPSGKLQYLLITQKVTIGPGLRH